MPETTIADRFKAETATHEMTILHDDGLYRHLRFKAPENGFYWFELATWPGKLAFTGGLDGFVFSVVGDPFDFFRRATGSDGTNPSYWAEKVVTAPDSLKVYSEDLFRATVAEDLAEAEADYPGVTEAWNSKVSDIWPEYYIDTEEGARQAVHDFEYLPEGESPQGSSVGDTINLPGHGLSDGKPIVFATIGGAPGIDTYSTYYVVSSTPDTFKVAHHRKGAAALTVGAASGLTLRPEPFQFSDTQEWDLREPYWQYLWCCHAIVWGIAKYDAKRTENVPVTEAVL